MFNFSVTISKSNVPLTLSIVPSPLNSNLPIFFYPRDHFHCHYSSEFPNFSTISIVSSIVITSNTSKIRLHAQPFSPLSVCIIPKVFTYKKGPSNSWVTRWKKKNRSQHPQRRLRCRQSFHSLYEGCEFDLRNHHHH